MTLPEQSEDHSNDQTGPDRSAARPTQSRNRRSQAERTGAMRARLSLEAYRIVAESGVRGLTIRSLAAAAGVSQGAVLHHFPDKASIVLLAIEQTLTMARDDSHLWLESTGNAEGVLRAMLSEFRAFFFSDRFWVAMGITIEASKDEDLFPAVRAMVARLRLPVYRAWEDRLVELGWAQAKARHDVRAAAALVSGAAVRRFWADEDEVSRAIEEEWIAARLASVREGPA
jgi:AcrR family transcriptional regulator